MSAPSVLSKIPGINGGTGGISSSASFGPITFGDIGLGNVGDNIFKAKKEEVDSSGHFALIALLAVAVGVAGFVMVKK